MSFKILPEYHLSYEILSESTGQEFLSRPSLTFKQFTQDVTLLAMLCFALYQTFFFNVSKSFTNNRRLLIFLAPCIGLCWFVCEMHGRTIDLLYT